MKISEQKYKKHKKVPKQRSYSKIFINNTITKRNKIFSINTTLKKEYFRKKYISKLRYCLENAIMREVKVCLRDLRKIQQEIGRFILWQTRKLF